MSILRLVFGLDIGWASDYTSLVGVMPDRVQPDDGSEAYVRHGIWCAERFPHSLGPMEVAAKVPEIIKATKHKVRRYAEKHDRGGRMSAYLAVDTSNDRSFVDHLPSRPELGAWKRNVVITSGNTETLDPEESRVSRTRLITNLKGVTSPRWNPRRIGPAPGAKLSAYDEIAHELMHLQKHVTASRNLVYRTRSGEHDDLVMALAMAVWLGGKMARYKTPARTAFSNIAAN